MKFIESAKFNHLYNLFLRELKLQGKSKKTIQCYGRSFRRISEYFDKHPNDLTPQDLKAYFSDLVDSHSWSTVKVDRWGLRLFWETVLDKKWHWPNIVRPPKTRRLPDILSIEEVNNIMSVLKKLRYQACLFAIYSLGLRLEEGLTLAVGDIDSKRMLVHVRNAKGRKDRLIPLPHATLQILRRYWVTHRNSQLIFPNLIGTSSRIQNTSKVTDRGGVQSAMKAAVQDCKIKKKLPFIPCATAMLRI